MRSKTILIADADHAVTQMLSTQLEQLGYFTTRSPDATHALCETQRTHPDLIILDVDMPGGNGMAVCEMLASDPHYSQIPAIIYTTRTDEQTKRRCQEVGAHYILKSPQAWTDLEGLVSTLLDKEPKPPAAVNSTVNHKSVASVVGNDVARDVATNETADTEPTLDCDTPPPSKESLKLPKVLCIDDDPDVSRTLMIRLRPYGVDVLRAFNGMQGFWTALDNTPDLVILDINMPDGGGNYLFGRFRDHPLLKHVPILVLTGVANPAVKRNMLALGVDAYVEKPLVFDRLLEELRRHLVLPKEPEPLAHIG